MGELILPVLESLLEGALEWLMLQFCNLIIASWHVLQTVFSLMFFKLGCVCKSENHEGHEGLRRKRCPVGLTQGIVSVE